MLVASESLNTKLVNRHKSSFPTIIIPETPTSEEAPSESQPALLFRYTPLMMRLKQESKERVGE